MGVARELGFTLYQDAARETGFILYLDVARETGYTSHGNGFHTLIGCSQKISFTFYWALAWETVCRFYSAHCTEVYSGKQVLDFTGI